MLLFFLQIVSKTTTTNIPSHVKQFDIENHLENRVLCAQPIIQISKLFASR